MSIARRLRELQRRRGTILDASVDGGAVRSHARLALHRREIVGSCGTGWAGDICGASNRGVAARAGTETAMAVANRTRALRVGERLTGMSGSTWLGRVRVYAPTDAGASNQSPQPTIRRRASEASPLLAREWGGHTPPGTVRVTCRVWHVTARASHPPAIRAIRCTRHQILGAEERALRAWCAASAGVCRGAAASRLACECLDKPADAATCSRSTGGANVVQ